MIKSKIALVSKIVVAVLLLQLVSSFVEKTKQPAPPNVVVIMADDLGYADVGYNGCKDIPTIVAHISISWLRAEPYFHRVMLPGPCVVLRVPDLLPDVCNLPLVGMAIPAHH